MPTRSTQIGAYRMELQVWETALKNRNGIKVTFKTAREAYAFRGRMNAARSALRKHLAKTTITGLEECEYDCLQVVFNKGDPYVIVREKSAPVAVETLDGKAVNFSAPDLQKEPKLVKDADIEALVNELKVGKLPDDFI